MSCLLWVHSACILGSRNKLLPRYCTDGNTILLTVCATYIANH